MRKKIFLFIIAAFMATSSAWAWKADPEKIDAVPMTNYLQNMTYDANLKTVTFDDQFHVGNMFTREYQVRVYDRDGSNFWAINGNSGTYYIYGDDNYNSRCVVTSQGSNIRRNSSGGSVTIEIGGYLDQCYSKGSHKLRVFIVGWYVDPITSSIKQYVSENAYGDKLGAELTSYIDVDIPSVKISKIRGGQYNVSQTTYTADNGDTLSLRVDILGVNWLTYSWERSQDNGNTWTTCPNYFGGSVKNGDYLTANDARNGQTLEFRYPVGNGEKNCQIRFAVEDSKTKEKYYSSAAEILFRYAFIEASGTELWYSAGQKIKRHLPQDCHEFKFISDLPVSQTKKGEYIEFTMPACDLKIEEIVPTYTVKFFNQDYTLLKAEEVPCGGDATAPADPTMPNLYFDHWSRDFTNVHSNLTVWAQYTMAGNYYFDAQLIEHLNERHPIEGFAESTNRAMVGDALTFQATLLTPQEAKLYYETCYQNQDGTWTLWSAPTNNIVGSITAADVAAGQTKEFTKQVEVALQSNQERERSYGFAFRFYVICGGERINSEPFEYDVYYPITVSSQIDFSGAHEGLFAENSDGLFNIGEELVLPTRYEDTIRIYRIEGGAGACINYTYVEHPSWGVHSGLDVEGNSYFLCPGATSTINVDVAKTLVIFDGVYGNGYPKQLDFTAEGFSKVNGYYGEVVPCGGSVTMPEDPTQENAIFIGWEAWSSDYADDAYLNVPVGESMIGFTAQFEYLPEVPTYTVIFFDKDGNILSTQEVKEGENAVPPVAPEVAGFHFVGWDSPYTTITNDKDITAVYGEDSKTWTVTYLNWDNSPLGTEQVNDGEAAQGVIATRTGYTFTGWSEDISSVKSDMTVTALFAVSVYTITYTIDGAAIMSEQVNHGEMPTAYLAIEEQGKPSTEQYVYTFDHWNPAIVAATQNATYEAVFAQALRKYTVRFQNWDHSLLDEQEVEYGKAAQAPADPTREGYTFKGWDREFNNIIANMTVTALFEKNKPQGIEDIVVPADKAEKVLIDGILYIALPDGKTYNAQGAQVQ